MKPTVRVLAGYIELNGVQVAKLEIMPGFFEEDLRDALNTDDNYDFDDGDYDDE